MSLRSLTLAGVLLLLAPSLFSESFKLRWNDNSNNEDGFRVFRSLAGGSYQLLAELPANTKQYVDSDLLESTEYSYKVAAFNAAGESGRTNAASKSTGSRPLIVGLASERMLQVGETASIPFEIESETYSPGSLMVKGESSNSLFLPDDGIAITGEGRDRVLVVSPSLTEFGSSKVTLTVDNGLYESSETVTVYVEGYEPPEDASEPPEETEFPEPVEKPKEGPTNGNDPPIVELSKSEVAAVPGAALAPVFFMVRDRETRSNDLTLSWTSDNPALLPENGVRLVGGGSTRDVMISPAERMTGSATIKIWASDGTSESEKEELRLTVEESYWDPVVDIEVESISAFEGESPIIVPYSVSDLDTDIAELETAIRSSNPELISNSDIESLEIGGQRFLSIYPQEGVVGDFVILIEVSGGGAIGSDEFGLSIDPKISIERHPINYAIQEDGLVRLSILASGQDLEYQWYRGLEGDESSLVHGATQSELVVPYDPEISNYWVKVSNGGVLLGGESRSSVTAHVGLPSDSRFFFFGNGEDESLEFGLMVKSNDRGTMIIDLPGGAGAHVVRGVEISEAGYLSTTIDGFGLLRAQVGDGTIVGELQIVDELGSELEVYSFFAEEAPSMGISAFCSGLYESHPAMDTQRSITMIMGPDGRGIAKTGEAVQWSSRLFDLDGSLKLDEGIGNAEDPDVALRFDPSAKRFQFADGVGEVIGYHETLFGRSGVMNISAFANLTPEGITAKFSLKGSTPGNVLIRGIGPTLVNFEVESPVQNPRLSLYEANSVELLATNQSWYNQPTKGLIQLLGEEVGAFPVEIYSMDAALLVNVEAGDFEVVLDDLETGYGKALWELYGEVPDPNAVDRLRISNASMIGKMSIWTGQLSGGFVVAGTEPKQILIRAIGPELGAGFIEDPVLSLYSENTLVAINDDWDVEYSMESRIIVRTRKVILDDDSKSAAILAWLEPGLYAISVMDSENRTGLAKLEIFVDP